LYAYPFKVNIYCLNRTINSFSHYKFAFPPLSSSKIEFTVLSVMFLDQELSWLVLLIREWDDLCEIVWGWLLSVVDGVTIDDDVLSKILVGVKTVVMWWRWLVDRPIIEGWVNDGILSFGLYQIVSVNSINNNISKFKVLVSLITVVMWWRWLVDGPVVERWVPNWVFGIELNVHVFLLVKVELIWSNANLSKSESSLGHGVISHH